jgi:hypothetical protein
MDFCQNSWGMEKFLSQNSWEIEKFLSQNSWRGGLPGNMSIKIVPEKR